MKRSLLDRFKAGQFDTVGVILLIGLLISLIVLQCSGSE